MPRDIGTPGELAVKRAESSGNTPAKGSGQIQRAELREATDEMATREMDPEQFRALLAQESARTRNARTPTIPATHEVLHELVAQTAVGDDDDLAIPVESAEDDIHQPHEPLDLRELEPRRGPRVDTRHVEAIAPLAKPEHRRATPLPIAPHVAPNRITVLLVVLVLALGGAVAFYVLTGRVA